MIKIYILRHEEAVAAKAIGGLDRDRTLTPRGEKNAADSARGMAGLGVKPDRIWTSPYPRAAQTARITAAHLAVPVQVEEVVELTAGATAAEVGRLLGQRISSGSVMLVGHNPDLENLVAWLVSPRADAAINLKKGALALVQADTPLKPGCGTLRWLLLPAHMGRLSR